MAKRNGARLVIINREATDFDEIADFRAFEEMGLGAEARERTKDDFGFEAGGVNDTVGLDEDVVA